MMPSSCKSVESIGGEEDLRVLDAVAKHFLNVIKGMLVERRLPLLYL